MARFTEQQENWLRENIYSFDSYADLTARFNEIFGEYRKVDLVREKCTKRLKISMGKNAGQFVAGAKTRDLPIGTIRKSQTGIYIKVSNEAVDISGYARPNWLPLQQKIYEDAHGKLPEGYMVCFLDCNRENFDLSNLYPVNRQISVRMAQNGWWSNDPTITLTGILQCELQITLNKEVSV